MSKPTVAITIGKTHYERMMSQNAWDTLADFAEVIHHPESEAANKEELIALLPSADACIDDQSIIFH